MSSTPRRFQEDEADFDDGVLQTPQDEPGAPQDEDEDKVDPSAAASFQTQPSLHPLLIHHILSMIFSYFENDSSNMRTCRLVCHTWKSVASNMVKKSLRWGIGTSTSTPTHSSASATPTQNEDTFLQMAAASNNKKELLHNFAIRHPMTSTSIEWAATYPGLWLQQHLPQAVAMARKPQMAPTCPLPRRFLKTFGHLLIDLKIYALELPNLNFYLQYMPNLRHLQLIGCWMRPDEDAYFLNTLNLDNLSSLSILCQRPLDYMGFHPIVSISIERKFATACDTIMDNAPRLGSLECDTAAAIRVLPDINPEGVARLTTLKFTEAVQLEMDDIHSIREYCTGLKVLVATFHPNYDLETEGAILRLIWERRLQFEEVQLLASDRTVLALWGVVVAPLTPEPRDLTTPRPGFPNGFEFPDCPLMRKLVLKNWDMYNNFNFGMPALQHLETTFAIHPGPPMSAAAEAQFPNVTVLRFGYQRIVDSNGVEYLAQLFPRVQELQCELLNDRALSVLFSCLPNLTRLHLGRSHITDSGITGLHSSDLDTISTRDWPFDDQFAGKVEGILKFRTVSGIGALKDLEHFSFDNRDLSRYSVYLGFVKLKELKHLRLPPFRNRRDPSRKFIVETVAARALADNCPVLAKLDVCGTERTPRPVNSLDPFCAQHTGCGLTDEVIEYVKNKLPFLELVYREPVSLSWRIQTCQANHVVVVEF